MYNGDMNNIKNTQVRFLRAGDVLVSGFVVTHNPYRATRTPSGKMVVEGHYPGKEIKRNVWSAGTVVNVVA